VRFRLALAVAVLAVIAVPATASATDWLVTNTGELATPVCPSAGSCTLRGAVTAANGGSGDTVTVPAGDYSLSTAEVPITASMRIVGPSGPAATKVTQLGAFGIFTIAATAGDVTISGLTLTGAKTDKNGAVSSQAPKLTLSNDVFTQNKPSTAGAQSAGAVQVSGAAPTTLTVSDSTFSSNAAGGDGNATASSGQGSGGAISFRTSGSLTVATSVFTANTAGGNGGAGTSSAQGSGGAIFLIPGATGSVTARVSDSTFTGNKAGGNGGDGTSSAQGSGGAIALLGSTPPGTSLTIERSIFSGNTAGGNGGVGVSSAQGGGGGISVLGGPGGIATTISASFFDQGRAGGTPGTGTASAQGEGGGVEILDPGSAAITNSTFGANSAPSGSGGSLSSNVPTTVLNDTFLGGSAGAAGNITDGGTTSKITLKNTIVAGGTATTSKNCGGPVTSAGHNIEDAATCNLTAGGDKPNTPPALGPLGGNGGPTQTFAKLAGSPAIDAGDDSGCPDADQRGALRPAGAACDIGAFEVATPAATSSAPSAVDGVVATFNGVAFNPDVAAGSAYFEFGTSTSYGKKTAVQAVAPASRAAALSAVVAGLQVSTTYHYRLVVTNALGTAVGADRTFKTTATPILGSLLSRLALSSTRFAAARGRGASITRKRPPVGTTVRYSVSEKAVTTFTVQRPVRGYRSGKRCVSKRPKRGKARRCTRYRSVGSFSHNDVAGANSFHFTGRVKRRPLRVGRYRLRAVARNGVGQISRPLDASFRIVR
jgi:hypothetical protein